MSIDLKDIREEIESGLPNTEEEREHARKNQRFARSHFKEFPTKTRDARYTSLATRRTSPIFKRCVEVLTGNLYKNQPTRRLADSLATEFLNKVYKRTAMWAKWKAADELTLIGGYSALQFAGHTDPTAPVKALQWAAHEQVVWTDPDDATEPHAVAVIDLYDNSRRLRLWTKEQVLTFTTAKGKTHPGTGGTAFKYQGKKDNPYRKVSDPGDDEQEAGILPFSFSHWYFPTQVFEKDGPGDNLRLLNESVNERLDRLGDSIPYNARPIGVAQGVDANWKPPAQIKPGDFLKLPGSSIDAAGNGQVPTLFYLSPDLAYIDADWSDLEKFLDHTLEMHGIPPSLIRMVQQSSASGIAIQSEQLPLLQWVEGRRGAWAWYEEQAAKRCLLVAESHLRSNGQTSDAARIQNALKDWEFSIRWPELYVQLPGQGRDMADDWRMERGLANKVTILMERQGLTEQEAIDYLGTIKKQNDKLAAMGIETSTQPLPALGGPATNPEPFPTDPLSQPLNQPAQGQIDGAPA
jgi:hypothetical protein